MQRDVDGQDDPFQKLMAVSGAVSLPDELFCVRKKALSTRVLSSEAVRPKGKRKAGIVGRRSDLRNRANEGCQRPENRRISG